MMMLPAFCFLFLLYNSVTLVSSVNEEGLALLSFRASINKDMAGGFLNNWNSSDANPCSWNGVSCRDYRVVSLTIPNKSLSRHLPPDLGKLSFLQHVNLRNNNLSGSLQVEFFKARELQSLVLSANSFSGPIPSQIADLKSLRVLDLSQNALSGSIPSSLVHLKKLKILNLGQNGLSGSIPEGFATHLAALQKLSLSHNQFTGAIPEDMGHLSKLQGTLDLSHNFFSGSIPTSLDLPERVYVDLSYNNLSGLIPQIDSLVNVGPTAFIGNPLLCGFPLKFPCPSDTTANSATRGSKSSCSLGIFITVAVSVMVVICLIGFLVSCRHKKISALKGTDAAGGCNFEQVLMVRREFFCFANNVQEMEPLSENMKQYNFVRLDSEDDFDLDRLLQASAFLLGKGGNGIVYKVVMENGQTLVVRRLGDERSQSQKFKDFQTEAEAVGRIRHPNIMPLRAYSWSLEEKLLIYDYAPNGDLSTAIHGKAEIISFKPLPWPTRLRIIKGIANGLAYLHEFSPKKYVHGDLKASNILLGSNLEPLISNFGLARLASKTGSESQTFRTEGLTFRTPEQGSSVGSIKQSPNEGLSSNYYQAPEASKVAKPSQKWDVYSYGVIVLEIVSARFPLIHIGPVEMDLAQWIQLSIEKREPLSGILDPYLVYDLDMEEDIFAILDIAIACIHKCPERRPIMRHICDLLANLS